MQIFHNLIPYASFIKMDLFRRFCRLKQMAVQISGQFIKYGVV